MTNDTITSSPRTHQPLPFDHDGKSQCRVTTSPLDPPPLVHSDLILAFDHRYGFGYSTSADPTQDRAPLYPNHPLSVAKTLISTANYIVNPRGKGIYATDETPEGIEARLKAAEGGNPMEYSEDLKRERRMKWRADLYETMPSGELIMCSMKILPYFLPDLSNSR